MDTGTESASASTATESLRGAGASGERQWRSASTAALAAVLLLGGYLRAKDYFSGRSLWVDEAMLALNIVSRDFRGLLAPLERDQAAPVGFLYLEKLATLVLGNTEAALRLVPFVASLAALPLLYAWARPVLGRRGAVLALWMTAVSPSVVLYSTDAKQYSTDLLAGLLALHAAAYFVRETRPWRGAALLAFAGCALPFFSHGAVFVIAGAGLALLCRELVARRWTRVGELAVVSALVVLSLAAQYRLFWSEALDNPQLVRSHTERFLPFPPRSGDDLEETAERLLRVFDKPLGLRSNEQGLAALALGLVVLVRRRRIEALVVALPILLAAVAAAMQRYPFNDRFLLFAVPLLAFAIAAGFEGLLGAKDWRRVALGWLAVLILPGLTLLDRIEDRSFLLPREKEELRPVLAYVKARLEPQDAIYVHRRGVAAFDFYTQWGADRGLFDGYHVALGDRTPPEVSLEPLLARSRVWLIASHFEDEDEGTDPRYDAAVAYLDRHGRRADEFRRTGAQAILFDGSPAPPTGAGD